MSCNLFGMYWQGSYYYDRVLPFGLRNAPFLFNQLSEAIESILLNKCSISSVCHILDDFSVIEPPSDSPLPSQACKQSLSSMLLTLRNLSIPTAAGKTQGPCTCLEFMGIILDSVRMEARLPDDKVKRIQTSLTSFKSSKSCTLRELQALIGSLNFACRVVPPERAFLQPMIELTRKVFQPHHHIKLTSGFFKDLNMWQEFISGWNGASFFLSTSWTNSDSLHLYTDASGSIGFGGILSSQWFNGKWRAHQQLGQSGINIAWQELFALVVACHLWGSTFSNKRILFFCDNQSVVEIVNS